MPYRPKRPCSYPGCPRLTDGRYCEEHQKIITSHYNRHERDPESKRRYGRAWRRIRDGYLSKHPMCEKCQQAGKLTAAVEVHHIRPLSKGGTHAEANLMALCKKCHSEITAREGGRYRVKNRAFKLGIYPQFQGRRWRPYGKRPWRRADRRGPEEKSLV